MPDICKSYIAWRDVPGSCCKTSECRFYAWDSYTCERTGEVCGWKGYPERENKT